MNLQAGLQGDRPFCGGAAFRSFKSKFRLFASAKQRQTRQVYGLGRSGFAPEKALLFVAFGLLKLWDLRLQAEAVCFPGASLRDASSHSPSSPSPVRPCSPMLLLPESQSHSPSCSPAKNFRPKQPPPLDPFTFPKALQSWPKARAGTPEVPTEKPQNPRRHSAGRGCCTRGLLRVWRF